MKNYLFILLIAAFILSIIGFYNGYPLVHSDTGTYIYSGFDKFVPKDRPITYGLFVWFFSAGISLWYVIIIQNIITAFILYEAMIILLPMERRKLNLIFLLIISFLTFFTGIGWYSNQIMPDFFAPMMILSMLILLFSKSLPVIKKVIFYIILILSLIIHSSHIPISLVLIVLFILANLIIFKKRLVNLLSIRKAVYILITIVFSWILLSTIHVLYGGQFKAAPNPHVFLIAHLVDNGILKEYLTKECDESYQLYKYRDSLPTESASFLWATESIFNKTGGWDGSEKEYKKIIYGTLKKPKYLFNNIQKSLFYSFSQLFMIDIGQGLSAYKPGSAPFGQINWRFPDEINTYLNSKQNKWNGVDLNLKALNIFHLILMIFSFVAAIILIVLKSYNLIEIIDIQYLLFIFLALLSNSMITAGLNSPLNRYQARVVWLLPFILILIIIRNRKALKKISFKTILSG